MSQPAAEVKEACGLMTNLHVVLVMLTFMRVNPTVVLREKDSVLRGSMPVVSPGGTRASREKVPSVTGKSNNFFTMHIERSDMKGTHYLAPRFGKADLARMVVQAQNEVDRSASLREIVAGPFRST